MFCSVLLEPPDFLTDKPVLTLLGAVGVAETVERSGGLAASIKWPNDVLIEGRKTAGVLVEGRTGAAGRQTFVLGIGLNTGLVPPFPGSTSLGRELAREVDRTQLASRLLVRLDRWYRRLLRGHVDDLEEAWRSRSADVGKWLAVKCDGQFYEGKVLSVSLSGGVELRLRSGRRVTFKSEQVVVL